MSTPPHQASDAEARHQWAYRFITAAPDAPAYGTAAWLALPDGPAKVAAVVRAAECWATDHERVQRALRLERDERMRAAKVAEDAAWAERSAEHRRAFVVRRQAGRVVAGFRPDPRITASVDRDWRDWVARGARLLDAEGALRVAIVHGDRAEIAAAAEQVDRLESFDITAERVA